MKELKIQDKNSDHFKRMQPIKETHLNNILSNRDFRWRNHTLNLIRLKITRKLDKDIFGQYKAVYQDDNQKTLEVIDGEGSNRKSIIYLNKGDEVTVDFMTLRNRPEIGEEIETDKYCLMNYAKNPDKGFVVVITGTYKAVKSET